MPTNNRRTRIRLRWTKTEKGFMPRKGRRMWGKIKCADRPITCRSLMFFDSEVGASYFDGRKELVRGEATITYIEDVYPDGRTESDVEDELDKYRDRGGCEIISVEKVYR